MSIRRGRPNVQNPVSINMTIRFSNELMQRLRDYCEANNKTIGGTVREGVELFLKREERRKKKEATK